MANETLPLGDPPVMSDGGIVWLRDKTRCLQIPVYNPNGEVVRVATVYEQSLDSLRKMDGHWDTAMAGLKSGTFGSLYLNDGLFCAHVTAILELAGVPYGDLRISQLQELVSSCKINGKEQIGLLWQLHVHRPKSPLDLRLKGVLKSMSILRLRLSRLRLSVMEALSTLGLLQES